jgi:hypothetical protein
MRHIEQNTGELRALAGSNVQRHGFPVFMASGGLALRGAESGRGIVCRAITTAMDYLESEVVAEAVPPLSTTAEVAVDSREFCFGRTYIASAVKCLESARPRPINAVSSVGTLHGACVNVPTCVLFGNVQNGCHV